MSFRQKGMQSVSPPKVSGQSIFFWRWKTPLQHRKRKFWTRWRMRTRKGGKRRGREILPCLRFAECLPRLGNWSGKTALWWNLNSFSVNNDPTWVPYFHELILLLWCRTLFLLPCKKYLHEHPPTNFIWKKKRKTPLINTFVFSWLATVLALIFGGRTYFRGGGGGGVR